MSVHDNNPTEKTPVLGRCANCDKSYNLREGAYKKDVGMICSDCYQLVDSLSKK